eukprot:3831172-Amphidinium_carterae.1
MICTCSFLYLTDHECRKVMSNEEGNVRNDAGDRNIPSGPMTISNDERISKINFDVKHPTPITT